MSRFPGDTSSSINPVLSPSSTHPPLAHVCIYIKKETERKPVVEASNRFTETNDRGGRLRQGKYVNLAKFSFTQPPVYQKFNWIFGRGLGPGRLGSWPASSPPPASCLFPPTTTLAVFLIPHVLFICVLLPSLRDYYSSCPFHLWLSSDCEIEKEASSIWFHERLFSFF